MLHAVQLAAGHLDSCSRPCTGVRYDAAALLGLADRPEEQNRGTDQGVSDQRHSQRLRQEHPQQARQQPRGQQSQRENQQRNTQGLTQEARSRGGKHSTQEPDRGEQGHVTRKE